MPDRIKSTNIYDGVRHHCRDQANVPEHQAQSQSHGEYAAGLHPADRVTQPEIINAQMESGEEQGGQPQAEQGLQAAAEQDFLMPAAMEIQTGFRPRRSSAA